MLPAKAGLSFHSDNYIQAGMACFGLGLGKDMENYNLSEFVFIQ